LNSASTKCTKDSDHKSTNSNINLTNSKLSTNINQFQINVSEFTPFSSSVKNSFTSNDKELIATEQNTASTAHGSITSPVKN